MSRTHTVVNGNRAVSAVVLAGALLATATPLRAQNGVPTAIVACPSPSPSPTPSASAAPAPSAAPRPTAPLRVSPRSLQLNAGMCARVGITGGIPPFAASVVSGAVTVSLQPDGSVLALAVHDGSDTIAIVDASGATAPVPVLVAPDAGVLPAAVSLQLAGGGLTPDFQSAAIANQLARTASLRPGASVAPIDPRRLSITAPSGAPWAAPIAVTLSGAGRWRDVTGDVPVQVQIASLPWLDPALLFDSDDPETVLGDQAGVVFHGTLGASTPTARVFAYHEFETAGRQLYLVLASAGTSHVQVVGDSAGPSYTTYTGHVMSVRFLQVRRLQRSAVAAVDANPMVLAIGGASEARRLVTGIFDLRLLDGAPVDVYLVAGFAAGDPTPVALIGAPPSAAPQKDGHDRAGVYPLGPIPPISLSASITAAYRRPHEVGTFATVGSWALPPTLGRRYLGGDYGVARRFMLTMTNVTDQPGTIYLYVAPSAAGATTSLIFDGDGLTADGRAKAFETVCLQASSAAPAFSERYLLRAFVVPPTNGGPPLVVNGDYMTDGGSTYPVELGLSLDRPLPLPSKPMCVASPSPAPASTPPPAPPVTPSPGP